MFLIVYNFRDRFFSMVFFLLIDINGIFKFMLGFCSIYILVNIFDLFFFVLNERKRILYGNMVKDDFV